MGFSKKLLFIHISFLSSQTYWAIILAFMQVLMLCNVYRSCRLCSWSYLYVWRLYGFHEILDCIAGCPKISGIVCTDKIQGSSRAGCGISPGPAEDAWDRSEISGEFLVLLCMMKLLRFVHLLSTGVTFGHFHKS